MCDKQSGERKFEFKINIFLDLGTQHLLHVGQKFRNYHFEKPLKKLQRNREAFQREDFNFPLDQNFFLPEFEKGGGLCTKIVHVLCKRYIPQL